MNESFEVLSGVLDIRINREWRELRTGESITAPPGTPHTVRNLYPQEVRIRNVHDPALAFPDYMVQLRQLVHSGKVRSLPPRDPAGARTRPPGGRSPSTTSAASRTGSRSSATT